MSLFPKSLILAVVFALVHVLFLAFYSAFVLWDLPYVNWSITGQLMSNAYSWVWWCIFIFFGFNFLIIVVLLATLLTTKYRALADLHLMLTFTTTLINVVMVVLCVIIYFFFINKNYSFYLPFNDPKWCCGYFFDNPGQCSQTVPCPLPFSLTTPYVFVLHWIFSGVFVALSIFHLGINSLLRWTGVVPEQGDKNHGKVLGIGLSLVYMGLFAYWASWPLWNTVFVKGYPLLAIAPSPGAYFSALYGYQWWFLFFMSFSCLPPILFLILILNRKSIIISSFVFWIIFLIAVVQFACIIVFLFIWIFDCNNMFSQASICNDYRYCCRFFVYGTATCPNVTPCDAALNPNPDFIPHLVMSFVFSLASTLLLWAYYRLREYNTIR